MKTKEYIGSQEHWEDSINADWDRKLEQYHSEEQIDNREQPYLELPIELANILRNDIEKLRDDIEKCTESLDLIKDSDIIQMYGSIIGRLNLILNQ